MTGRANSNPNHRLAAIHGGNPNERYFPLCTSVSPGYARGSPPLSNSFSNSLPGPMMPYHREMTIRAVSPDIGPEEGEEDTDDSLTAQHSPTTPPRTPSRSSNKSASMFDTLGRDPAEPPTPSSPGKARALLYRTPLSGFPQFADLSISKSKNGSPADERRKRTSPSSSDRPGTTDTMYSSGSSSHGSRYRNFASSSSHESSDSIPASVGFPSTTALSPIHTKPPGKPSRQRFLRPQNSANALNSGVKASDAHFASPPATPADTNTILRLMRDVRGRMEGHVEFRVGDNMVWTRGYCLINEDTGSLVHQREENINSTPLSIIVPDLRGCKVKSIAPTDEGSDGIIEVSTHSTNITIKLRPMDPNHFMPWLAALLCWQPIAPAGAQNKMVKSQAFVLAQERKVDRRRNSDATASKDASIIKVGKMLKWRKGGPTAVTTASSTPGKGSSRVKGHTGNVAWQRVSCTLQENGEFRLYAELDTILLTVIQLSQLSRCAVQQLDPSILDKEFCIAIYPQYTPSPNVSLARPVYLGIDSRILFEVWFVLLRAFTMPELYGPAGTASSSNGRPTPDVAAGISDHPAAEGLVDSYRIQRSLFLRVVEAKISMSGAEHGGKDNMDCYAEVVLDGEVRAKTMVRTKTHNPFWREDYEFPDLPAILSDVGVVLKQRHPKWKTRGSGSVTGSGGFGGGLGGVSVPGSKDAVIGAVEIQFDELKMETDTERWWPLMSTAKGAEERIGEMFLKIGMEELVVLMAHEYMELSELLHSFSSGVTMEIAQVVGPDLRRLADTLLKIYQVSGRASEWLMSLAEGEIDGLHKESPPVRLGRHRDSNESNSDLDQSRRDVGKAGLVDANILFRGNSLLTKALDAHMKRLGREYLEETLGEHLRDIADDDTYCEVDPLRMEPGENLMKNWKTLMGIVKGIWKGIYNSHEKCPMELRKILRHIRVCVADRYGDLLKTVCYSSVCGFLFLRFFCPAILNPKLFGLLKDHPGVRAQRTLTLVAKSLQGLANMSTFGVKEPWMEQMNEFLGAHSAEMKSFVDAITTIPSSPYPTESVPPSYATPITILSRLSQPSKEGFPSLPYLIDQPRAFASLVSMWQKWYPVYRNKIPDYHLEGDLARFHKMCSDIQERIDICVSKAESAQRPSSSLSARWEEVAEKATGSPLLGPGQASFSTVPGKGHRVVGLPSTRGPEEDYHHSGVTRSKLSGFVGGFRKKVKSRGTFAGSEDE
ncbi:hypothetical protein C7212DRAFT_232504 [Tuber magnatum]|uniref:Rho GTPase activation protein n=1 Tax=Tuber magnatum TaxID=42249 RepID=A0A317SD49_9PEZI|nr:hypothetical protein C7212DRAFT_232504 [Tuber magnatum]